MEFTKYENSIPYPTNLKEWERRNPPPKRIQFENAIEYGKALHDYELRTVEQKTEVEKQRQLYYEENAKLEKAFKTDLYEELEISHLPTEIQEKVYSIAYAEGHAEGKTGIYQKAIDFAELALFIWNFTKEK